MFQEIITIIIALALIAIAVCNIRVTFFEKINIDNLPTGVEYMDTPEPDENSPLFRSMLEAYNKAQTVRPPHEYIQTIIDDSEGVEVITDEDEITNRRG